MNSHMIFSPFVDGVKQKDKLLVRMKLDLIFFEQCGWIRKKVFCVNALGGVDMCDEGGSAGWVCIDSY